MSDNASKTVTSVVGVPGLWSSSAEAAEKLKQVSGLWFAGPRAELIDTRTSEPLVQVDVSQPDSTVRRAFEVASAGSFAREIYDAIERHTMTIYLVDPAGGSLASAQRLMRCATALLDAGGLAVKVESSGVAHTAASWKDAFRLCLWVRAFVITLSADGLHGSCGMHNLGFPEGIVRHDDVEEARATLDAFVTYLAYESPRLEDGHTFRRSMDALCYELRRVDDDRYPAGDLFHNPFGFWELTPVLH